MSFVSTYKPLFTIALWHHYFLDDGTIAFDSDTSLQEEQLASFNFKNFISILPSSETLVKTIGQKIVLKHTNEGLTAFIKAEETAPNSSIYTPYHQLKQTTTLTFLLYINDSLFGNYSTVAATPSIPFYFSNKKPVTEPGSFKHIDITATKTIVASYGMTQTTFDTLSEVLTEKEKIGLFGVIQLEMQGDNTVPIDTHARNIVNLDGTLPNTPRAFKIQFENRETIWNYRDASDSSLLHSSDPQTLPLVKNGIVGYSFGGKKRPAADASNLVFEKDGGGNIIKTISEIYIN